MRGVPVFAAIATVAAIGFAGVMAWTNPSQEAYETFATRELTAYLDREVCPKAPTEFGLRERCRSLLETEQFRIRQLIASNTHRQNLVLFSLYRTELAVPGFFTTYRVESVGAFQNFYIYQAGRR